MPDPPDIPAPHPVPGPAPERHSGSISAGELALVCSNYDIGVVESARKFRRGSGSSPKVVLKTSTGVYLLKRRAAGAGRDDPFRVALSHEIQISLRQRGFPAPELIGTRRDHNSMLQTRGRTYELFRFVPGVRDDGSVEAAAEAGSALGLLHTLLADFKPGWQPPSGGFHSASPITRRLGELPGRLADPSLRGPVQALTIAYQEAGRRAGEGVSSSPTQLLHGDWHPGNMLFVRTETGLGRILAVVDFDSVRLGPRVLDAASGALQFSLVRTRHAGRARTEVKENPQQNPIRLSDSRFAAFVQGYHRFARPTLGLSELAALPWLMVEALVAEAAVAAGGLGKATGRVAPSSVPTLLRFVEKKVGWLMENAPRLAAMGAPLAER